MSKLQKDIRGKLYIFDKEKNIRKYSCSNLLINQKKLSFHRYEAAAVQIFNSKVSEYFTFTPEFGRFEAFTDLFDYVEFWLNQNKIPITSVNLSVDEMSVLIYKIDLDTMKLLEEKERISGSECLIYEYREVEKSFFDPVKNKNIMTKEWGWYETLDEDKEKVEYEDIDPQF